MEHKKQLLSALKTAMYIIDDLTQDTTTDESPYLEQFAEVRIVFQTIEYKKQIFYVFLALIFVVSIIGRFEEEAFEYCEKQTRVTKAYCLKAHNIK